MKKKREFQSSELVNALAKSYGFEDKLLSFQIKDFLEDYLDEAMFREIQQVDINKKTVSIRIQSPLLKNDFRMRKSFFLKKIQNLIGEHQVKEINIL